MKKVSTLKVMALMCAVPFFVNGQSASRLEIRNSKAEKLVKVAPGSEVAAMPLATAPAVRNISATAKRNAAATIVGSTTYDLQSNGGVGRRVLAYADGKVTVAWTGSTDGTAAPTWPDRGSFSNSFNGTAWGAAPTARLESKRTGWANLVKTTAGEVNISHTNAVTANTGSGTTWAATRNAEEFRSLTWPRAASSGDNVYAIISSSGGDAGFLAPVFYGRSTNGGASFDTLKSTFAVAAGYDTINHAGDVGADSYEIAARGSVVAMVISGTTEDVVMLKSMDNGVTWTRTIVREFPIKKYVGGITDANGDSVADTLLGSTGNVSIVIDNQNVVHLVWCDLLILDADGSGLSVFLTATSDYINYWNDANKAIVEVPVLLDKNGDGKFNAGTNFTAGSTIRYGNSGYSLHPELSVGAAGTAWADNVYMTYVAVAENDTNDIGVDFRSIFVTGTPNKGADWYEIMDVSQTQNVENAWVSTASEVGADGKIHMIWQQDFEPGNAVQGQHPFGPSDIIYDAFDATSLKLGVGSSKKLDAAIVAYPNPTSDVANFNITLNNATKAELKLVNMLGQTVRTLSVDLNAGVNKVSINVAELNSGLYTMVLTSNGKSATEKIMVK